MSPSNQYEPEDLGSMIRSPSYSMEDQFSQDQRNFYQQQYPDPGNPFLVPSPNPVVQDAAPSVRSSSPTPSTNSWSFITEKSHTPSITSLNRSNSPRKSTVSTYIPSGHRHEPDLPRGVYITSGAEGANWQPAIESIIKYNFTNADLLEEALESPDSGVVCVGSSHRHLGRDGNKGLASVGGRVMELMLAEQAYGKKMSDVDAERAMSRLLHRANLERIGKQSRIERFVRRRKSEVRKNTQILKMLKEDATGEDPSRTVARAIKAVLGAVYFDGGVVGARKVMGELGLEIK